MTSDVLPLQSPFSASDTLFFKTCLFRIEEMASSLSKPLVDPQAYPPYPFDFDTASQKEKADYLDNCVKHWIEKGLISPGIMIRIPEDDNNLTLPAYTHDLHVYKRIIHSIAYSLQHPKATDPNGTRDPHFSLGRFIDVYLHSRGNNVKKSQFNAFCIVDTEETTIPDHYGHSAALSGIRRKPTEEEKHMEQLYRRALVFPTLNGNVAYDSLIPGRPVEQCAENIALPYILEAALQFLTKGKGKRVITIYSLTMSAEKEMIEFCMNCKHQARHLTANTPGLRIVDRGQIEPFVYESDATYKLWARGRQEGSSSNDTP